MEPGRTKKFQVALVSGAAIVAILSVVLALGWPFTAARIRESLSEAGARATNFDRLQQTFFPSPGCVLERVSIEIADGARGTPLITAREVKIETSWINILTFRHHAALVRIADGRVFIPAKSPAANAAESIGRGKAEMVIDQLRADGAILDIEREDGASPLHFQFGRVTLFDLGLHTRMRFRASFENPEPPGHIAANGNFGPWKTGDPGATPVAGTFSFTNARILYGLVLGTLGSEGQFEGPLGRIRVRGNLRVPDFSVNAGSHPVDLKAAYRAMVNGTNGDVDLDRVDSEFLDTKIEWRGKITGAEGSHGKRVEVEMNSSEARIQDLFRPFVDRQPPFRGSIRFLSWAVLEPGPAPFLKRLRGGGDFGASAGQFTSHGTEQEVARLSAKASGKSDREADEASPDVLADLRGHVDLRDGAAAFSGLIFNVPGAAAQLSGTYMFGSERVDLHGTLSTQATLSHDSQGIKSFLLKPFDRLFKTRDAGAVVPISISGTAKDPIYRAYPKPTGPGAGVGVGRVSR